MTQPVNTKQIGGTHYKTLAIQPWDYVLQNNLGPLELQIIKYVTRYKLKHKDPLIDLNKALHNLEKLIEYETQQQQVEERTDA